MVYSMISCQKEENVTVLVIEKNPDDAGMLKNAICGFGYKVIIAFSRDEAVRLATGEKDIRLVIVDIDIEDETGLAMMIERILSTVDVPIVFLGSGPEHNHISRSGNITRYGYIEKGSGMAAQQSIIETSIELYELQKNLRIRLDACRTINSATTREQGFDHVMEAMLRYRGIDCDAIFNCDPDGDHATLAVWRGLSSEHAAYLSRNADHLEDIQSAAKGGIVTRDVADTRRSSSRHLDAAGIRSAVYIPIHVPDRVLAVIAAYSRGLDSIPNVTIASISALTSDISNALLCLCNNAALRESEEKYRRITENMSDVVIEVDKNGTILYVSPSHRRIFGEDPEELIGMSTMEGVHPDDLAEVQMAQQQSIENGNDFEVECRYRHKQGNYLWLRTSAHPRYDDSGHFAGLILTNSDITGRKRVEKALRDSEARYRQLFTHAPAGIWEVDFVTHRFSKVNSLICEYTGFSEAELLSMSPLDILSGESRQSFINRVADLMAGKPVPESVEYCIDEKNGNKRWIELNNQFIREDGRIVGSTVVAHDISERRLAADKIRKLLEEKEVLLKEVHHRIKNNMNTMMSLLALQADAVDDPSAVMALNDASNRLRSMGVLYNKLYDSNRLREMPLSEYIPDLVDEIVSLFPNKSSVSALKRVDDTVLDVKKLSPLGIIVNELVTNAMKYAFSGRDEGMITVSGTSRDGRVRVEIQDDGVGIPEHIP